MTASRRADPADPAQADPVRADPAQADPEHWEALLRAGGHRITRARRLILDALQQLDHPTVDDLQAAVNVTAPDINLSTIYRTLDVLGEAGLVTHTHLNNGTAAYHPASRPLHIHLICRSCGQVSDAPAELAAELVAALSQGYGFTTDVAHLALHGQCQACRPSGTADDRE